jgi:hypothetical protein
VLQSQHRLGFSVAKPPQARLDFADSHRLEDRIVGFEICGNL